MQSHYTTLGVHRANTREEIRSAYLEMAKTVHPDVLEQGSIGTDKFVVVHNAYKILSNPRERQQYNAWLDEQFVQCNVCKGKGVTQKQVTFTTKVIKTCDTCKGGGVICQ